MKLLTYRAESALGRTSRLGALMNGSVIDVNLAGQLLMQERYGGERYQDLADAFMPADLLRFIETGPIALETTASAIDGVMSGRLPDRTRDGAAVVLIDVGQVTVEAPLRPRTLREFSVFPGHFANFGRELPPVWYEMPLLWKGNPDSVVGPDTEVQWPPYTRLMDFELEIAAIIGKRSSNVDESDGLDSIFGYTIFNDISARDIQRHEMEFFLGPAKGKDFCNVLGPVVVTKDEFDPHDAETEVHVNGELWGTGDTRTMQFQWPKLVAQASLAETLHPGDVMTSGTVTNCSGSEYIFTQGKTKNDTVLRPGDLIELTVEGIGTLRNRVTEHGPTVSLYLVT